MRRLLPRTQGGLLWRALVGALLIVGFAAGATATTGLLQVSNLAHKLHTGHYKGLETVTGGAPETILVIGSDHRKGEPYNEAQTDTMLLIRLNDSSSTVNMMSVPRDLNVIGPQGTYVKLNAIYEYENGPSGLIRALRDQVFGPKFQVNHVVDVNFAGFSDLVDAIGCVYSDIDHRYYNVSSLQNNFSSIDIEPGYQRLCGGNYSSTGDGALAFVRFRETDSDVVRNARQQDFLRWARDTFTTSDLVAQESQLINIFAKHTEVDTALGTTSGLVSLADVLIGANSLSLKTIQFPEYFGACGGNNSQTPCYVYPCPLLSSCDDGGYVGPNPPIGKPTLATEEIWNEFMKATVAKQTTSTVKKKHTAIKRVVNLAGLVADPGDGNSQSAELGNVGLPIYYPKYVDPAPAADGGLADTYCYAETGDCNDGDEPSSAYIGAYPRRYLIFGPDHTPYKSYVMVLCISQNLGEYYTVQGTTWTNPPILRRPSRRYRLDNKTLLEYDDGGKISLVAFKTSTGTYWVSNTLNNAIPNGEMVAMAAEMTRYGTK